MSSFGLAAAAKGSCSGILGEGLEVVGLCLSARGFGFWRELRTLGEAGVGEEGVSAVGVLALKDEALEGGGGAVLEGM